MCTILAVGIRKNLTGLLRCLLYDTLEQCPDLIPRQWQKMISLHEAAPLQKEIRDAFERLTHNEHLCENHGLCIS